MVFGPLGRVWMFVGAGIVLALAGGCGTAGVPGGADAGEKQAVSTVEPHGGVSMRGKAQAYAQRLLAELPVPAGAQRTAWPAGQPKPLRPAILGDNADVWVAYRTGAPMGSVSQFLAGHRPPGMKPGGNGQSEQAGTATAETVNYVPGQLPRGIFDAQLAAVIVPASGGGSLLRADAEVTWYPERSPAEYIHAARYSSVTVTVPPGPGGPAHPATVTRTFTSQAVVARLAGLINGLPAMPPLERSCPAMAGQPYSMAFTPRLPRWPRIVVTPDGCFGDGVTVGGRAQPGLAEHHTAVIAALLRLPGLQASGSQ